MVLQDLFVDRLVERVDKLREEIAMYEAQAMAQHEETKATRDALSDAQMEMEVCAGSFIPKASKLVHKTNYYASPCHDIEDVISFMAKTECMYGLCSGMSNFQAISLEKKQLFQQWNSSLTGMRRRDEAHAAMMEALTQQQQRIRSLETEIDGYKRYLQQEQEQNEKLTLIYNKTVIDISTVKKLLQQCQEKHDALKNEYATYTRMLHETEQALNRANTVSHTLLKSR